MVSKCIFENIKHDYITIAKISIILIIGYLFVTTTFNFLSTVDKQLLYYSNITLMIFVLDIIFLFAVIIFASPNKKILNITIPSFLIIIIISVIYLIITTITIQDTSNFIDKNFVSNSFIIDFIIMAILTPIIRSYCKCTK